MTPGILDTLQLAVTLVFAIPVALFGIDSLVAGDTTVGVVFLALAALMIGLQQYLTTPADVPASVAERLTGRLVKTGDDEKQTEKR